MRELDLQSLQRGEIMRTAKPLSQAFGEMADAKGEPDTLASFLKHLLSDNDAKSLVASNFEKGKETYFHVRLSEQTIELVMISPVKKLRYLLDVEQDLLKINDEDKNDSEQRRKFMMQLSKIGGLIEAEKAELLVEPV